MVHVVAPVLVLTEGAAVSSLVAATARLCGPPAAVPTTLEGREGEGERERGKGGREGGREGEGGGMEGGGEGGKDRRNERGVMRKGEEVILCHVCTHTPL